MTRIDYKLNIERQGKTKVKLDNNKEAFFELVRAGLWEKEARLLQFDNIDYASILQLAEEQSVVGLVTAGL